MTKQITLILLLVCWSPLLSPATGDVSIKIAREYIQILEKEVFACVLGQKIRVYFNPIDWVEVKCKITDDNLWEQQQTRKLTTGVIR